MNKKIHTIKLKKSTKIFLIVVAILALAIVITAYFGSLENAYQKRVNTVRNEVLRVEKTIVQPAGGRNYTELSIRCPHYIDSVGQVDINCPTASQAWYIAIDKNMSPGSYIVDIFQELGYTNHQQITDYQGRGSSTAYANGFAIGTGVGMISPSDEPYKLPESMKWVVLSVSVYEDGYPINQPQAK